MLNGDTIFSTMAGIVSAWGLTHYYFKKSSPAERIAAQIKLGLQKALYPLLYPQFFDGARTLTILPEQPQPTDRDVPRVEFAKLVGLTVHCGQEVQMLIKLKDDGFDLDNPRGITVRDHRDNPLAVVPLGFGYIRISFRTADNERFGQHRITVEMIDMGHHTSGTPNRNTQSLVFVITGSPRPN